MTISEWDGTPWEGKAQVVAKAATGPGVGFYSTAYPMFSQDRTPQAIMRRAQMAYHANPWIATAERAVTRKVVGLPWHFEDGEDEEYGDDAPPDVKSAIQLIERPQMMLGNLHPATASRRLLQSLTSRHIGLCGMAHWYKDRVNSAGIPEAFMYVNPARMWAATDSAGNLTGWVLDAQGVNGDGQPFGGVPFELEEILTFYLDPGDHGHYGVGLYEAAVQLAHVSEIGWQHANYVLGTGGRIAGIVSPKDGTIPAEAFKTLVAEFRNVNEAPDAAKRTTIMQGPIDFTATAGNPGELQLAEMLGLTRDDIFTVWNVPGSQVGIKQAAGLNSGSTKGFDEAVMMQGPVHDRVIALKETIQYGWLDKYLPTVIEYEIEEPTFDDEGPAYDLLTKSQSTALTNRERRELIGLPPTGDDAIDNAILLPSLTTLWATAPAEGQTQGVIEGEEPPGEDEEQPPAKAQKDLLGIRKSTERIIPAAKHDLASALAAQRDYIVAWVRKNYAHLQTHPKDDAWWNRKLDKEMTVILDPYVVGLAEQVQKRVGQVMAGKARNRDEDITAVVRRDAKKRIVGINDFTRAEVADAIEEGIANGLSMAELGDAIEALGVFGEERAERIARTETMFAYNSSALLSYTDFGVEMVEPIDGDQDPECIARLERGPVSITEALADEDHPNGTLDWVPYFGKADIRIILPPVVDIPPVPPAAPQPQPMYDIPALVAAIMAAKADTVSVNLQTDGIHIPAPIVNVEAAPAPNVHVETSAFVDALADIKAVLNRPRIVMRSVVRDETGRIVAVKEEEG